MKKRSTAVRKIAGLEHIRGRSRPIVSLEGRGRMILRTRSRPVSEVDRSIQRLVADMHATMRRAHGVGLAAVQIGVPLRVLIADPGTGPVALVNPKFRRRWGSQVGPEGCLSIPGAFGLVRRSQGVVVEAQTIHGRSTVVRGTGLLARILQHEVDHLNGVLIIDRIKVRRRARDRALPLPPGRGRIPASSRAAARRGPAALRSPGRRSGTLRPRATRR